MKNATILSKQVILRTLRENEAILQKYKVKRIGLFGSYARSQQRRKSDIDFLVEFKEPTYDNFIAVSSYLERLLGRKVDLITTGSLSPRIEPYVEKEVVWHEVK